MASTATATTDFITLVAEEIAAGIDRATEFWLARVEQELTDPSLSCADRIRVVEAVLHEYKEATGKQHFTSA